MHIQSCCQRADIRCPPIRSTKKKKKHWCKRQMLVVMRQRWTGGGKDRVVLRSSINVFVYDSYQRRCHGKVHGKKKSNWKVKKKWRRGKRMQEGNCIVSSGVWNSGGAAKPSLLFHWLSVQRSMNMKGRVSTLLIFLPERLFLPLNYTHQGRNQKQMMLLTRTTGMQCFIAVSSGGYNYLKTNWNI
jgi:hypothetical protein